MTIYFKLLFNVSLIVILFSLLYSGCFFATEDKVEVKPKDGYSLSIKEENSCIAKIFNDSITTWLNADMAAGIVYALVEGGGRVHTKGLGWADKENMLAMTDESVINVASVSKFITALGALSYFEKNEIPLNTSINSLLKKWKLLKTNGELANEVTIEMLLGHSGGVNLPSVPWFGLGEKQPTLIEMLSGQNQLGERVMVTSKPDSIWKYSGGGYAILEFVLHELNGVSLNEYFQKEIFDHIRINNSGFGEAFQKGAKVKYYDSNNRLYDPYVYVGNAAAGFYTTARDFSEIMHCLANQDCWEEWLSAKIFDTWVTPRKEVNLGERGNAFYGLGVGVHRTDDDIILYHSGSNDGVLAYCLISLNTKNAVFLASNNTASMPIFVRALNLWSEYHSITLPPLY